MADTTRLTITYGNAKIGADIESNVTLADALEEILKGLRQTEAGDYTVITDEEMDL